MGQAMKSIGGIFKKLKSFITRKAKAGKAPRKRGPKTLPPPTPVFKVTEVSFHSYPSNYAVEPRIFRAPPAPAPEVAPVPPSRLIQQPLQEMSPQIPSMPHLPQNEFWAFLESFLKLQNSKHTKRAYEKDLNEFLDYLKAHKAPMSVHTLIEYRSMLEKSVSPRTGEPLSRVSINRKIATLKSFLNFLVLNGILANNPAKAVKSFKAGRESPTRDVPDDLVRKMFEIPSKHTAVGRMHASILMILFRLGLRRSELIDLRTSDIFEDSGMHVMRVRGKGDKERVLPLPEDVYNIITVYLEMAGKKIEEDQVLFTPEKNNVTGDFEKNLNPNTISYIVKRYAALAGVRYRVSPHSARATAVSNALDHAAPHRAVQHMAGWSSPLMVTRYDKRKADLKNSAVKFVNYSTDS